MLGQSYGLLTNRALIEFMARVHNSKYKLNIKPIAAIHDALYFICKKDPEVIHWLNINLIECMEWQELEDIKHPEVKLGAELELFLDGWDKGISIKNRCDIETIQEILNG